MWDLWQKVTQSLCSFIVISPFYTMHDINMQYTFHPICSIESNAFLNFSTNAHYGLTLKFQKAIECIILWGGCYLLFMAVLGCNHEITRTYSTHCTISISQAICIERPCTFHVYYVLIYYYWITIKLLVISWFTFENKTYWVR